MLKRSLFLILAAGVSTLLTASCAAPSPTPQAEPAKPAPEAEIQAESPVWRKIAEEAARGRSVAQQQQLLESERHYELALAWFNKADFEKAKIEAQAAIQIWPEHIAARKLLADVGEIIVGAPTGLRSIRDVELQIAQVRVEQQQIEIVNHLIHGQRYLDAKMYASALREFQNAEFKIRNMPYEVKSMNDLLPKAREQAQRARSLQRE